MYASLTALSDPGASSWIVVGENEFEVYGISRDGAGFAALASGTESVLRTFESLDSMLWIASTG